MTTGDFGAFGLLWILMNLIFLIALIAGAFILATWAVRRSQAGRPQPEVQLPETNGLSSRLDTLRARFDRGEISQEQYQQTISRLKQEPQEEFEKA